MPRPVTAARVPWSWATVAVVRRSSGVMTVSTVSMTTSRQPRVEVRSLGTLLDIGEVRARTGLAASTLHHYERKGLIRSVERVGLRRQYEPVTIQRLAVIVLCQRAGFRLDEIAEILATDGEPTWRDLVGAKLTEIRARIRALEAAERGLEHALQCPSADVLRCEHFRAELKRVIPVRRREQGRERPWAQPSRPETGSWPSPDGHRHGAPAPAGQQGR